MNDYLAKPLKVEEVTSALARWLPRAAQLRVVENNGLVTSATATLDSYGAGEARPSLDPAALHRLWSLAEATEAALLARILKAFTEDATRRTAALRSAIRKTDDRSLAHEAHALKGACLNTGAHRMADLCQRLRELSLAHQTDSANECVDQLEIELTKVRSQIESELKRTDAVHPTES